MLNTLKVFSPNPSVQAMALLRYQATGSEPSPEMIQTWERFGPDELANATARWQHRANDRIVQNVLSEDLRNLAAERAACGGWPEPVTPADFLMWIKDEIEVQQAATESDLAGITQEEADERFGWIAYLGTAVVALESLGVEASTPPWVKEFKPWTYEVSNA